MGLAKIFNESGVPHTVQIDEEGALANGVAADWFASKQIHVVKTDAILVNTGKEIDQLIEQQIGVEVTPAEVKQVTKKGFASCSVRWFTSASITSAKMERRGFSSGNQGSSWLARVRERGGKVCIVRSLPQWLFQPSGC